MEKLKRHKMTSKHFRSVHLIALIKVQRKEIADACIHHSQENNIVLLGTPGIIREYRFPGVDTVDLVSMGAGFEIVCTLIFELMHSRSVFGHSR
ncbi:hypothetical protein OUZ56_032161 [Daphnia magna]|uniref:Uncharacterized protein n=1 Tax=Daphnia magna TaxID=35525 RepID=A0ABQ9ZWE6_9CRUS|nr:hypothetical protein OUZ56_032161 [Daphnia magna]